MPARWERTQWAIAARQAAAILLLTAVIDEAAAGQAFDPNPQVVGSPSSSGAIAPPVVSLLPPNLVATVVVRSLVASMWRLSPTFRRQCARLAEHPEVLVHIEFFVGVSNDRASASIEGSHGGHHVAVYIEVNKPALYVEHIAHELEHVLEVVDGTDLPSLARQRVDGVMNLGRHHYETARAQSVGRMVAREVKP
jgi:hypothetical protein